MNFRMKNIDIKIMKNNRKNILKIFLLLIIINIFVTIIGAVFANIEILKSILLYIISVIYIGICIYILKKQKERGNLIMKKYDKEKSRNLTIR